MIIYYLDDEVALCELFDEFMSGEGVNVSTFNDAQSLIIACQNTQPDLVVLDYRLTETTGDKVAAKLDSEICKVLVTGELDLPRCDLFTQIITKPYKLSDLKGKLMQMME
ncbi:hypothetical protein PA25_35260 [Pseudoalteromonas sp. A25]|uniref:response regulator n=1 Tax=Pseudoalteromonas sp. A25 TaxID=116092 RepID=UPI0012612709|nr:response regulator [Pseudoalteromonas sp. A25]BBN83541.1 hypothetical protein PA25_35260 [Pseudoalteromonas sp. A25]